MCATVPHPYGTWQGNQCVRCTQKSTLLAEEGLHPPPACRHLSSALSRIGFIADCVPLPAVAPALFSGRSVSRTSASFFNTFNSQQAFRAQNLLSNQQLASAKVPLYVQFGRQGACLCAESGLLCARQGACLCASKCSSMCSKVAILVQGAHSCASGLSS